MSLRRMYYWNDLLWLYIVIILQAFRTYFVALSPEFVIPTLFLMTVSCNLFLRRSPYFHAPLLFLFISLKSSIFAFVFAFSRITTLTAITVDWITLFLGTFIWWSTSRYYLRE